MTETTHDDAVAIIKQKLAGGAMSWGDLLAALGWTRGRLQHHVDLMEGEGEIFTDRIVRGNRWIKMLSLTPFEEKEEDHVDPGNGEGGDVAVQELQGKIILEFGRLTALNIKDYLRMFIGDALPDEILSEMDIGKQFLEHVLKKLGYDGAGDPRLNDVMGGD